MKTTKRTARNKFYFLAATSISFLGSTESYHKKISFTIILKQNISKKNIESNAWGNHSTKDVALQIKPDKVIGIIYLIFQRIIFTSTLVPSIQIHNSPDSQKYLTPSVLL